MRDTETSNCALADTEISSRRMVPAEPVPFPTMRHRMLTRAWPLREGGSFNFLATYDVVPGFLIVSPMGIENVPPPSVEASTIIPELWLVERRSKNSRLSASLSEKSRRADVRFWVIEAFVLMTALESERKADVVVVKSPDADLLVDV